MILTIFCFTILVSLTEYRMKYYDLFVIAVLLLVLVNGKNVPDRENYETVYNYIADGNVYRDTGDGWYALCKIGAVLELNYLSFNAFVTLSSLLMIRKTVNYFVSSYQLRAMVWALYLIYPALLDCVQTRFLLAQSIVIFAIPLLLYTKSKMAIGEYVVLVMISSLFHSSAMFYFLLLLVPMFGRIRNAIPCIVGVVVFSMIAFKAQVIWFCGFWIDEARLNRYFYSDNGASFLGLICYGTTLVSFLALSNFFVREAKGLLVSPYKINCFELFELLSILIFLIIPFAFFDTNFFRMQRPLWLLLYIIGAAYLENGFYGYIERLHIKTVLLGLATAGALFYIAIFTFNVIAALLLSV